ncbi:LysR family transcriptional regulator [Szabonella alba]|uniref:LysR family transcriptional regulator n=1 Tax=Szabonella alba TaxID=2804194 RepID=A0A8K0XZU5_9RHOB|nr:LysR family transcriptional regulator [Szabonella alba]MBL4917505.1 LysR family transcriptional regulator [Szabonella alba]
MPHSWDDYRFMHHLHRLGTMAAVARRLNTTTATVSRRIEKVNHRFGFPVFSRRGERWVLNPDLEPVLEVISRFADEMEVQHNNLNDASTRVTTALALGCPPYIASCILLPNMTEAGELPEHVELTIHDRAMEQGLGDCDILLRHGQPEGGRLVTRRAGATGFRLYRPVGTRRMDRWAGLTRDLDDFAPMRRAAEILGCPPSLRVSQFGHLREAILATGLPGLLPDILAAADDRLEPVWTGMEIQSDLWLTYHETRRNDRALRATVDWILASFAKCEIRHSCKPDVSDL